MCILCQMKLNINLLSKMLSDVFNCLQVYHPGCRIWLGDRILRRRHHPTKHS